MSPTDPRFIYLLIALPILFGMTLLADGLSKVWHEKHHGWITLTTGVFFLVFALFIISLAPAG